MIMFVAGEYVNYTVYTLASAPTGYYRVGDYEQNGATYRKTSTQLIFTNVIDHGSGVGYASMVVNYR